MARRIVPVSIATFVAGATLCAGCGPAFVTPPPPCTEEAFFFAEGSLDGAPISSGCIAVVHHIEASLNRRPGQPDVRYVIHPLEPWPNLTPFCNFGPEMENIDLVTGASGAVVPPTVSPTDTGFEPRVYISLGLPASGQTSCDLRGEGSRDAMGTWHVIQGGTYGDVVELEFRNIEFAPQRGHTLRITRLRTRFRLRPLIRT